jgi:2'-5' RNA ligase
LAVYKDALMTIAPAKHPRLFYAVWPDPATRQQLKQWQRQVQGRNTHIDDFHLTLAFLGERPPELLPVLKDILLALPALDATFVLNRFGYFEHHKIAWAGMTQPPPELFQLQAGLMHALEQHGITTNHEPIYTPHVTLARKAAAPQADSFAPIAWHAHTIALAQSGSGEHGAKYEILYSR